jgi:hypothetical protein
MVNPVFMLKSFGSATGLLGYLTILPASLCAYGVNGSKGFCGRGCNATTNLNVVWRRCLIRHLLLVSFPSELFLRPRGVVGTRSDCFCRSHYCAQPAGTEYDALAARIADAAPNTLSFGTGRGLLGEPCSSILDSDGTSGQRRPRGKGSSVGVVSKQPANTSGESLAYAQV